MTFFLRGSEHVFFHLGNHFRSHLEEAGRLFFGWAIGSGNFFLIFLGRKEKRKMGREVQWGLREDRFGSVETWMYLQPWAPQTITFRGFLVNNLVFRGQNFYFLLVLGAHIVFFPFSGHFPVNHDCERKSTGLVDNFIELE